MDSVPLRVGEAVVNMGKRNERRVTEAQPAFEWSKTDAEPGRLRIDSSAARVTAVPRCSESYYR